MRKCYHRNCDSKMQNEISAFADMGFYTMVVQTLIDTTVEASEARCNTNRNIQPLNLPKSSDYYISSCEGRKGNCGAK